MKKWRRVVAAALAGAMMLGTTGIMSYADEAVSGSGSGEESMTESASEAPTGSARTWELVDGNWYFYNKNGKAYRNRIIKQGGQYFYLGDDYAMASNELIYLVQEEPSEEEMQEPDYNPILDSHWYEIDEDEIEDLPENVNWEIMYAASFGNLVQNTWRMIDGYGKASYDEDNCDWYFFDEDGFALTSGAYDIGEEGNQSKFCFYPNGVMVRCGWYAEDVAEAVKAEIANEETADHELIGKVLDAEGLSDPSDINVYAYHEASEKNYYFQHEGFLAEEMRYVKGDWYYIDNDENGYVSNLITTEMQGKWKKAQINTIEDLYFTDEDVSGAEIEIEVGKTIELEFEVEFATASNAREGKLSKYHDIYVTRTFYGENPGMMTKNTSAKQAKLTVDGGVVRYTATAPGTVEVNLHIDDLVEWVTITSVLPTDEAKLETAAADLVENALKNSGTGLETDSVNALKAVANEDTSGVAMTAMTNAWTNNQAAVESMENALVLSEGIELKQSEVSAVAEESLGTVATEAKVIGAALLAEKSAQLVVDEAHDVDAVVTILANDEIENVTAIELDLAVDGEAVSELELPVIIQIQAPEGFENGDILYHIHEDGEPEEVKYTFDTETNIITFAVNKFSTFVFAQKSTVVADDVVVDNNNDSDDDESETTISVSTTAKEEVKPVVTIDEKKGQVSSETGIITGTGEGYSEWIAETAVDGTTAWKFEYADGTMAAGTVETRADGTTYVQPAWEMINGKWFAFGADAYAMSSWVADEKLGGWFYVDINFGMLTGWQQIGSVWYYLNPISNGKKGICLLDAWIDGWYVDATGAWDGKAQVVAQ